MITESTPSWICPNCKHEEVFILASAYVLVNASGCDIDPGNCGHGGYEWEDDSPAHCPECEWKGTANDAATAAQEKYPELAS